MFEASLEQIACPGQVSDCGGRLKIRVDGTASGASYPENDDIVSGLLRCDSCSQSYPIIAGIAVLLPDWCDYIFARQRLLTSLPVAALPVEAQQVLNDPDARDRRNEQGENWESDDILNAYLHSHFLADNIDGPGELDDLFSSARIADQVRRDWPQTPLFLLKSWLAGDRPCGAFLELGCSVGGTVTLLAELLAGPYLGLDVSIRAVAVARRLVLGAGDAAQGLLPRQFASPDKDGLDDETRSRLHGQVVDFVVANAWRPPVAARTWDFVSAMNMVDFSPDPMRFVRMQSDLLRPGGRCFTSAPLSTHSPASKSLSDHATGSADSPTDALADAYRQAGLALSRRQDDLPWIVPRGPRYVEYFSVDALLLKRLSAP